MRRRVIIAAIAIILVVTMIAILLSTLASERIESPDILRILQAEQNQTSQDDAIYEEPTDGYISIPSFDYMSFRANRKKQTVKLENPAKNKCYFQIRLLLSGGNEIYSSDMIAPGETVTTITLNKALSRGQYEDAILQYSCYTLDTLKALNGANIKVTLEVV
ncbi:MAG: hypothetical protein E7422_05030 [Ruminococcaceae bacterium]|jgi:hypothetical protein|nr:hypothetical protein [Oscillospiraceae bacterium]